MARALQRAAALSNESPTQWVSLESVSKSIFDTLKKPSLRRGTAVRHDFVSVRGLEGAVEQVRDLFRRGLAAQRHDDRRDQAAQEAGDDLIQAGRRGQERIPQSVDREAHAHARDRAGIRQPSPIQREQNL